MVERFIPFHNRTEITDRIIKVLTLSLVVGLLSSIGPISPAQAVLVTATGTNPTICNQEVSSSTNVVAYRLTGGDCVIEFRNVATVNWTVPTGVTAVQVLTVGGGGGGGGGSRASSDGGRGAGGGGEGGEAKYSASYSLTGVSSAAVVVGSGGASGAANNNTGGFGSVGSSGGASTFNGANSAAGGTGGGVMTAANNLGSGGNGGGLVGTCNSTTVQGSEGSANTYFAGCNDWEGAGGGAGAGANGGNGTDIGGAGGNGGAGGVGLSYSITDAATFFGGGGGGGGTSGSTSSLSGSAGAGGNGGGGAGSIYGSPSPATSGTTNRGGGGGGGGGYSNATQQATNGGTGGSGIVIVRYTPDSTAPTYSSSSISSNGLSLTLTYSETLSATTAAPANFVVTVNSSETRTISTVTISGSSVTLALGALIEGGQSITVTYTDPTGGNDANAVQDVWGNDASTLSNQSITNTLNSNNDSAISLNGSNQYAAATTDESGFDISNAITIEAWIYPTGASCNGNIAGKATSYFMYCVSGTLAYAMGGASGWSGVSTGVGIPTNEWHHVALTRAASTAAANVYLDGNLVYIGTADGAGTSPLTNSNAPNLFNIGARNGGATFFTGRIDEVKLWNVARTQAQVQEDLRTYGGSLSDGLIAYYNFNDQSGSTLINRSTGGSSTLNLTLYNSPTLTSAEILETSTVQAYTVVKFMRTFLVEGGGWLSPSTPKRIRYLLVGGGGGGGNNVGGGGAGGGSYKVTNSSLISSTRISVTVGAGGAGGFYNTGNDGTSRMDGQYGDSSTVRIGATTYTGGGGGGGSTYWSNNVCGGSGINTVWSVAGSFSGSGGTGTSGALGGATSTNQATANGVSGYIDSITGTAQFYGAGGGAGGGWNSNVAGVGANSIGGNGSATSFGSGTAGVKNSGAGGGGGSVNCGNGGGGGSGVVVLRYITTDPTILSQPLSDTTTVGLTDTMTVSTSILSSPLSKSITWQFTSETTTSAASATWQSVSLGSGIGTDTYTTQTLTMTQNKYRYRAVVTFSDSDSLSVIETSTVATLTVNPAISITSDTSTITRKYGTSGATRSILSTGGTDTKTVTASSNSLADGKITFTGATGLLSIDTRTAVGTYLDTITVTDAKGASATYVQTIVMTAADTLTVTTDTPTAVTYTGSIASISPTVSAVSGLVSGDAINTATINYSASTATATCANGGTCSVGEIGPSGGYVFYVSPTAINVAAGISTGGIYLEAAPVGAQGTAEYGCTGSSSPGTSYGVGSGASNTLAIISNCATAGIAARVTSDLTYAGFSDWFMPSLDEMTLIYNNLYNRTPSLGGFTGLNYGSSSEGTNGFGYQAYWWFGSGAVSGQTNKNYVGYYRPIRAFSPVDTSSISYGPSTTKPTNAGTYTITPSVLTFTDGAAANYTAITYRTSMVTINKASQSTLSLTSRVGVFSANPSTMKLITSGGNDTGTVTYAISSGGTALNCAISGDQLSVTSTGTCLVSATKAATNNYLVITSDTVTVTFNLFVAHQPIQTQQVPTQIPINGANSLETTTATVPMITSISLLAGVYQVNGAGFSGVSRVTIGGVDVTYTYISPTQINIPTGAGVTEGSRIVIECTDGRRGPSPREIFRVFSS